MSEAALVNVICESGGAVAYDELLDIAAGFPDLSRSFDAVVGNGERFAVTERHGRRVVVAKTSLRPCRERDCAGCHHLHICKFYIHGECRQRYCRFGHDLNSDHNSRVLAEHQLQHLSRGGLRQLLLQNDNPHCLLPPVCFKYNRGQGEYGQCEEKENCTRLHICEDFIRGSCNPKRGCHRSHDFNEPHPSRILHGRGVSLAQLGSMLSVYQNIFATRGSYSTRANIASKSTTVQSRQQNKEQLLIDEICLYFVKSDCKHGEKCWRKHSKMPYLWQVKHGESWIDLPNNEEIERDFSDPSRIHSAGSEPVCFDTITCGLNEVRRLSTASSVVQTSFNLTTDWMWYWKDEYGKWIQYASVKEMHRMATVSCRDLEKRYQEDSSAEVTFTAGQQSYQLSFKDMMQKNEKNGTQREVRRRPVFKSSKDVQNERTRYKKRGPISQNWKGVPGYWEKSAVPDTGFKKVPLQKTDRDYVKIHDLFSKTLKGYDIICIERIQNKELWEDFQTKRERMKKANTDKKYGEGERLLFHGTNSVHIDAICSLNFDWRKCGTNGTVFGEGSYFARDAKYSHAYTSSTGDRCMFACRVLVGNYTKGQSHYRHPPSKDGGHTLYDSCVNDVHDPSIFVVFEKQQVYPEFLITYGECTLPPSTRNPVTSSSKTTPPVQFSLVSPSAQTSSAATIASQSPATAKLTSFDSIWSPYSLDTCTVSSSTAFSAASPSSGTLNMAQKSSTTALDLKAAQIPSTLPSIESNSSTSVATVSSTKPQLISSMSVMSPALVPTPIRVPCSTTLAPLSSSSSSTLKTAPKYSASASDVKAAQRSAASRQMLSPKPSSAFTNPGHDLVQYPKSKDVKRLATERSLHSGGSAEWHSQQSSSPKSTDMYYVSQRHQKKQQNNKDCVLL
uniref:Poly [ADP-ribose] polymerase 12-like n=1 Tax=Denticeps clupeoides TaxID=299321 RepID=A0AAY4EIH2_9TELE